MSKQDKIIQDLEAQIESLQVQLSRAIEERDSVDGKTSSALLKAWKDFKYVYNKNHDSVWEIIRLSERKEDPWINLIGIRYTCELELSKSEVNDDGSYFVIEKLLSSNWISHSPTDNSVSSEWIPLTENQFLQYTKQFGFSFLSAADECIKIKQVTKSFADVSKTNNS